MFLINLRLRFPVNALTVHLHASFSLKEQEPRTLELLAADWQGRGQPNVKLKLCSSRSSAAVKLFITCIVKQQSSFLATNDPGGILV